MVVESLGEAMNLGLALIKKNQKGRILNKRDTRFFFRFTELKFKCAICKKKKKVKVDCPETMEALVVIGNNPCVKMICPFCDNMIYVLDLFFDDPDALFNNLEKKTTKAYQELGWIE